jgi:hypothetical protein
MRKYKKKIIIHEKYAYSIVSLKKCKKNSGNYHLNTENII